MEEQVRQLFERYERAFAGGLSGTVDMDEVASLYATAFIGASPHGVMTGANDEAFRRVMADGYARYRAIGTTSMRLHDLRVLPLDDHHCVAQVDWRATYARAGRPDVKIDFVVHYFVQRLAGEAKVFGWVTGDEQAVLEAHGIG